MEKTMVRIAGLPVPIYRLRTVVIGSGCAGLNAADWLYDLGETDIALLTEGLRMGTSRNTGSDKQTYYKLSLAADQPDSAGELSQTLFVDGVHGDTAWIEAACSAQSFFKLVQLGVPFPTNALGEFVGYRTDHDPRQRATSAGPLTSKYMTECLEKQVLQKNIALLTPMVAFALLKETQGRICGVLAYQPREADQPH
ncbi:MAG: FAD-binding protein, partial [Clostridia bacterium]